MWGRIIAKGASGGLGPGVSSPSSPGLAGYGARVRAVFPFTAGTQIYFLVGQEGVAAMRDKPKEQHNRNSTETGTSSTSSSSSSSSSSISSNGETRRGGALERVRGLHNATNNGHGSGSGGGGGGATFVFQVGRLDPLNWTLFIFSSYEFVIKARKIGKNKVLKEKENFQRPNQLDANKKRMEKTGE